MQIQLGAVYENIIVIIRNTLGQEIIRKHYGSPNKLNDDRSRCRHLLYGSKSRQRKTAMLKVVRNKGATNYEQSTNLRMKKLLLAVISCAAGYFSVFGQASNSTIATAVPSIITPVVWGVQRGVTIT